MVDTRTYEIQSLVTAAEVSEAGAQIVAQLRALHEPVIDQRLEELQMIADGYPACDSLTLFCGGTK